jgi:hypothetical protein
MIAAQRVRRTAAALATAVAAGTALRGAVAGVLVLVAAVGMDLLWGLPRQVRELAAPVALAAAGLVAAVSLWRGRHVRHFEAVALWMEARRPALRYALVTLLDPRYAHMASLLEPPIRAVSWRGEVLRLAARRLRVPAAVLVAGIALLAVIPSPALERVVAPRAGDMLSRPVSGRAGWLSPLVVTVIPPAYTGLTPRVLEDPTTINGIVGSEVRIEGRGAADRMHAEMHGSPIDVASASVGWSFAFAMPRRAAVLRLRDEAAERVLALEPTRDSTPEVTLSAPLRDTVLRRAEGELVFSAGARDDWGLDALRLEYIVSAGHGERFTFRSGVLAAVAPRGREAGLRRGVSLAGLGLQPGDVVHVRAVAQDRNDVTGPGVGTSETRTLRVARVGEYDSVAIDALPPIAADTSLLSQRLLLLLAERLEERRPSLGRETVVAESRAIGRDQARLRRRVAGVIFLRLGGDEAAEHAHGVEDRPDDLATPEALLRAAESATEVAGGEALDFHEDETPVVAVNRPLLEAYSAMWEAQRELEVGEPGRALPHMRAALEAIQRARQAERVYLRGRPPRVVVDLARVRLSGERDAVRPAPRAARSPAREDLPSLARRFLRLLDGMAREPATADSLLVLRIDALERAPALAAALGEAAARLRAGQDPAAALGRARWVVAPGARAAGGLPAWSGVW